MTKKSDRKKFGLKSRGLKKIKDFKPPGIVKEFKDFLNKGNVLGLAVGIIIGIAFGAVITSMVNDVIMPPVGFITGGTDFSEKYVVLKPGHDANKTEVSHFSSLAEAKAAGANTWRYGLFINAIINFLMIALVLFIIVKLITVMKREKPSDPTTKVCPECDSQISIKAKRCPNCTSIFEENE